MWVHSQAHANCSDTQERVLVVKGPVFSPIRYGIFYREGSNDDIHSFLFVLYLHLLLIYVHPADNNIVRSLLKLCNELCIARFDSYLIS